MGNKLFLNQFGSFTKANASEDVGQIAIDLLWTNPDTSVAFEPQTVPLDLSEYDFVQVVFLVSAGSNTHVASGLVSIGSGVYSEEYTSNAGELLKRMFRTHTSDIVFEHGRLNSSTDNAQMVPERIYGIKTGDSF